MRRTEDGERLAAAQPDRLVPVLLDVTSPEQIRGAVETITGLVGERGLDGLVNNAGIAIGGPLEFVSAESLRQQFAVNVIGLHAVTTAFLPLIRRARRVGGPGVGRIVHVGSVSGRIAQPFIGPYSASKHAVEALADALRVELAPEGIHVAVIEPGQVRTPIWDKGLASSAALIDSMPPDGRERYGRRIQVFRWILERAPSRGMPPERVATAIRHALTAAEPRTRYLLGFDARVRLLLRRCLPDRLMDSLVLATIRGLERRVR